MQPVATLFWREQKKHTLFHNPSHVHSGEVISDLMRSMGMPPRSLDAGEPLISSILEELRALRSHVSLSGKLQRPDSARRVANGDEELLEVTMCRYF